MAGIFHGATQQQERIFINQRNPENPGCPAQGVAGIFHGATQQQERIFINQRKGFVKVAIQAGADLVPAYHFGSSQMLSVTGAARWAGFMLGCQYA